MGINVISIRIRGLENTGENITVSFGQSIVLYNLNSRVFIPTFYVRLKILLNRKKTFKMDKNVTCCRYNFYTYTNYPTHNVLFNLDFLLLFNDVLNQMHTVGINFSGIQVTILVVLPCFCRATDCASVILLKNDCFFTSFSLMK